MVVPAGLAVADRGEDRIDRGRIGGSEAAGGERGRVAAGHEHRERDEDHQPGGGGCGEELHRGQYSLAERPKRATDMGVGLGRVVAKAPATATRR